MGVKVLAAKHGDQSLNFRTHTVEGRKLTLELSSDFHVSAMVQKHTQTNNEIISSKKKTHSTVTALCSFSGNWSRPQSTDHHIDLLSSGITAVQLHFYLTPGA